MTEIVFVLSGLAMTLAGYFGPEDGGTLELCGLVVLGVMLWRHVNKGRRR